MKRYVLIISVLILNIFTLTAQNVQFTATATQVVSEGERFRLSFTVNQSGSNFRPPDLSNFNNLGGPSTSSSTSMQIINGQMSQSSTFAYSYVLQAVKQGKFTIAPAEITVGGKVYKSNSLTIEVVKGTPTESTNTNQQSGTSDVNNEDIFVAIQFNKSEIYVGEPVVATIKIYTKIGLDGFEDIKFPTFNGFWTQELETPNNISLQRENVNGKVYSAGLLKRMLLIPQKSGQLTIDPVQVECIVRIPTNRTDWFGRQIVQQGKKSLKSATKKINVTPLPSNKPDSFDGAVGTFNLSTNIDKTSVKQHNAITFKVTISGSGNLKLVEFPKITFSPDFEVYDPKVTESINNTAAGSAGSKTFEYLIIPRHAGEYKIPAIEWSFFDLKSKSYKTQTSNEIDLSVAKGDEADATTVISSTQKEDIKYIGSDIRYIKTSKIDLIRNKETIFGSPMFYLLYLLSLVAFFIIFFIKREQVKQSANLALAKNRKARRISHKRLKTAESFLKKNEFAKFYSEMLKALWGYLSDKLGIPVADLNRDKAQAQMLQKEVDQDIINELFEILDTCEFAQYAPSNNVSEADKSIFEKSQIIIGKLESRLR